MEIWHRLKDPVQTDRMGAPPLRPQGAEPAAGGRPGGAGPGGAPSGRLQGVEQEGEKTMGKIVIVGSGPAGCSAALYAARAGQEVVVISMGMGALSKAELIQNYYGFEEGITGAELYRQGVAGAKAVGAEFITAEVVGLDYTGSLVVQTTEGDYPADAVILATGAGRIAPKIAGLAEHEGRGVSYCATCDAFFYRGKTAAVLGSGEYALHEVQALLPLAGRVILCTNGEPLTADFPEGVEICTEKLAAVEGLFVALGVAGSAALARKLGAPVENGRIVVDERMQTGIPGLYAAGDCTGGLLQVCKAVYEGALAATEAIKQIRGKK